MARNKGNNHDETTQVQGSNVVIIDRISYLPHSILLHILALLPTRWRHLWDSVPALEFCDVGIEQQKFYNFVNKCIEHRMIGMHRVNGLGINRFKLEMHGYGGSVDIDRWLSFAVKQHLEELDLRIQSNRLVSGFVSRASHYYFPSFNYCIPSLTVLKLDGLKLADEVFHNLIMGCPSLEKLVLHSCFGFDDLEVSSLNLKYLELIRTSCVHSILVEAVNLQSFVFDTSVTGCQLNLFSCKNVRNLTLVDIYIPCFSISSVEDLIFQLPILESLTVVDCDIDIIQNQYLKDLVLKRTIIEDGADKWKHKMKITVDTPNLGSFHYEDVNFTHKVLLNSPNLEETNIILDYEGERKKIDMNWYVDMIDFLSYFDCSKVVSLVVYSEENLMFPEKLRKLRLPPLLSVKHLRVETRCELKSESLLRDALLWLSPHTQTLSIRSEENEAQI
ncbi:hypothetical protein UlMin_007065 [Ulmus minor]